MNHATEYAEPDHFTADERQWSELSRFEKRAQLGELNHADLVDAAMNFALDAEMWERQYHRLKVIADAAMATLERAVGRV